MEKKVKMVLGFEGFHLPSLGKVKNVEAEPSTVQDHRVMEDRIR